MKYLMKGASNKSYQKSSEKKQFANPDYVDYDDLPFAKSCMDM